MMNIRISPRASGIGAALVMMAIAGRASASDVDFEKDVRPILAGRCYSCHGPEKQKSDLRLDDREAAVKGGVLGPAIVPGKAADSDLIRRVTSAEGDEAMPPKGPKLSAEEVGKLRDWIDQGAPYPDQKGVDKLAKARRHWAFKAPTKPDPPKVQAENWAKNPIDRFILARLEKEGLTPSPEADRATLIRRLSLDLIGLPPTPEEVDAFLNDPSPEAYEKVVDRLLASPHYGERWGRHWLDAARYADSDGYEKDKTRHVWFYRDWVINAFNRDLPYDRFIIEQIAGDQLANATQDQHVATGFLRNSVVNEEGGIDPEQFRMEAMFDRMEAIGKGILGLTIQCAQCHNHKFDPISQEDYYRLFAFLNNDDEPARVSYTPDQQMRIAQIHREVGAIGDSMRESLPDWRDRMAKWEDERAKASRPSWTVVQAPVDDLSNGGQKYLMQKDGSFVAAGYAPTKHTCFFTVKVDAKKISAFRLELMNDSNLPGYGPGRSLKGTCALTEFAVEAAPADHPEKKSAVKMSRATADFEQPESPLEAIFDDKSGKKRTVGPASFAIDGNGDTAWGIDAGPGRRNVPREAVFAPEKPIENEAGSVLTIRLAQNHGGWNSDDLQTNNLGRLRVSVTDFEGATADSTPARVREILAIPREKRSPAQIAAVFDHWRTLVPEWKEANAKIEALWKTHPEGATTLVLQARSEPRMTNILKRGDFLKPVRPVTPGVPSFLLELPSDAPPTRLSLANWLVDPQSPTTARSFVNRVWQSYFGTGIVATSEDLGTQSEPPSHPELLDWLAREFMDKGWGVKSLHKSIVMSSTYRQSSKVTSESLARDPYNRLLARGARLRVEGEIIRDIQLAASGLLSPKMGGMSVMPPAPSFLFQPPSSYAPFPWVEATGPDRYRRAIYTWRRRSTPYPLLVTFDAPEGNTSCVRRNRSNTPLQALMTLNEPMAMEAARALAGLALKEGGNDDVHRLSYAFRRCVGRVPTDDEKTILLKLLDKERAHFGDGWASPWEILTGDRKQKPTELPKDSSPTQWAAYTVVARVLLNLDETITKE